MNFGDGGTGAGATTTHIYANSDVYTVTVTVSDGKGGTAAASAALRSRSLGGNWLEFDDRRYGYVIRQDGITLSGSRIDRLRREGSVDAGILTGTILDARRVRFQVFYSQTDETDTITATLDPGLGVMNYNILPANVNSMLIKE